jgi:predicted nucleic acid-binding protein
LNWFRDHLPASRLVLDTSVLLNLLGCGATQDVFAGLPRPCLVEEKVLGEVRRHPVPGLCHVEAIEALRDCGHVELVSMSDAEYAHFLSMIQAPLGVRLDAGESATLAVAHARGHAVVMDENKGRRYVADRFPGMQVVSSLVLFISATVRLGRDADFLRTVAGTARDSARMAVPRSERELLAEVMRR